MRDSARIPKTWEKAIPRNSKVIFTMGDRVPSLAGWVRIPSSDFGYQASEFKFMSYFALWGWESAAVPSRGNPGRELKNKNKELNWSRKCALMATDKSHAKAC
jgi:hypothetical protein